MGHIFTEKKKKLSNLQTLREKITSGNKVERVVCPECSKNMDKKDRKKHVCPNCGYHFPYGAASRLRSVFDKNDYTIIDFNIKEANPLEFQGYDEKRVAIKEKTNLADATLVAQGKIHKKEAIVVAMDSRFFMGSMGMVVGETISRAAEIAGEKKLPLIIFSASGGARMQEGILSLMQMAKTSAVIENYKNQGGLFISYLTHPTTGGVSASFASLGDITLAEPGALIGFAGPRVIEQTIGQKLPDGFQRAEYLIEHGFIDQVVPRSEMRKTLYKILMLHEGR